MHLHIGAPQVIVLVLLAFHTITVMAKAYMKMVRTPTAIIFPLLLATAYLALLYWGGFFG